MKTRIFQLLLLICLFIKPVFGFAQYTFPTKVKIPGQNTIQVQWTVETEGEKDKNGKRIPNGSGALTFMKKAVKADSALFTALRGKTVDSLVFEYYRETIADHALKFYGTQTFYQATITSIDYPKDLQFEKDKPAAVFTVRYKSAVTVHLIKDD